MSLYPLLSACWLCLIQFRMMWAFFSARHTTSSLLQAGTLPPCPSLRKRTMTISAARPGELHPPSGASLSKDLWCTRSGCSNWCCCPCGSQLIPSHYVTMMAFWIFCLPLSSPLPPDKWLSGLVFSVSACRRLFSMLHSLHLYAVYQ